MSTTVAAVTATLPQPELSPLEISGWVIFSVSAVIIVIGIGLFFTSPTASVGSDTLNRKMGKMGGAKQTSGMSMGGGSATDKTAALNRLRDLLSSKQ